MKKILSIVAILMAMMATSCKNGKVAAGVASDVDSTAVEVVADTLAVADSVATVDAPVAE